MRHHSLVITTIAGILLFTSSCKKEDLNQPKETILYETDFSSDDGHWDLTPFPNVSHFIDNGYLNIITDPSGDGIDMHLGNIFTSIHNHTAIETSLKVERSKTSENNAAGLIWNMSGSGANRTTYYFEISPIGGYLIYGYPNGMANSYTNYVDWTTNSLTNPGAFTKLRIELKDNHYHFYVNNTEVYSMEANEGETLDICGIGTWEGVKVEVDYFKAVAIE